MKSNLATVVEARLLVREALKLLMEQNSYHVVCTVGSAAEISAVAVPDEPKLVILGAESSDTAIAEAAAVRRLWPDSKIILLYEQVSLDELQKLQTSQINGCISLFASPDTLIGVLDVIESGGARVMVLPGAHRIQPAESEERRLADAGSDKLHVGHQDVSVGISVEHTKLLTNNASTDSDLGNTATQHVPALRTHPLSEREVQILKGLMRGHANKVIARTCAISEATVKVHIKSILRKIRVQNRTQAAVWALERDELNPNRQAIAEASVRSHHAGA